MTKNQNQMQDSSTQIDRFKETARALGCDEDKVRFEASLGKIAAHKATERKPIKKERPAKK